MARGLLQQAMGRLVHLGLAAVQFRGLQHQQNTGFVCCGSSNMRISFLSATAAGRTELAGYRLTATSEEHDCTPALPAAAGGCRVGGIPECAATAAGASMPSTLS